MSIEIRRVEADDREWMLRILQEQWGSSSIVTRGRIHDAGNLPGFVALLDGEPQGLLTFCLAEGECEIITLNSLKEGRGIGTKLLKAAREYALQAGSTRLWLVTTNDNLRALRFYQKRGFELVALRCRAIEQSRKLKPEIPALGLDGIPIRDEIELELPLE